ncbi:MULTISPECIES: hypothetical protein [unclassified Kitasatospora]|uniref:hypothetical protein n=1 Tax=unclassified Kitasatospora TaxID=2633591 RepID=UPI0012FC17AC|nr:MULTISPECIES: hypothetical protein [unclassified Kitasatospora]
MEFNTCQIDHIIPQDVSDDRLKILKVEFGLPEDFDLNDPQNLAPICVPCNGAGRKGGATYSEPVYMSQLKQAARHRRAVVASVRGFGRSGKVAGHLLEVITADLGQGNVREEFLEFAPTIVQILAMADSDLAGYLSFERVEVEVDRQLGTEQGVNVSLDERGRMTESLLKEVCGADLASVFQAPIRELLREIGTRATAGFEALESDSPICAGEPVRDWLVVDVESLDYQRERDVIEVTIGGVFECSLSAGLTRSDPRGDGLEDLQGDAVVSGTFTASASWDLADALSGLEAGDCVIGEWTQESWC